MLTQKLFMYTKILLRVHKKNNAFLISLETVNISEYFFSNNIPQSFYLYVNIDRTCVYRDPCMCMRSLTLEININFVTRKKK